MEVAAGAAYAGARSMVTMKQVGLNVAADPLMSLSYVGIEGGMVVVVADDPDRGLRRLSRIPDTLQNLRICRYLTRLLPKKPIRWSRLHSTSQRNLSSRYFSGLRQGSVMQAQQWIWRMIWAPGLQQVLKKKPDWIIFPALSYRKHGELEQKQKLISDKLSTLPFNRIIKGEGRDSCIGYILSLRYGSNKGI